jgi:P27 family predicted phage terminase small subunit
MGERGPAPMPANVHALRGNPSKKPVGELLGELRPPVVVPDAPGYLSGVARAEWERISEELRALGLVAKVDLAMLAMYCVAYGRWVEAEQRIADENLASADGAGGLVDVTPNGYRLQSVWIQISKQAQEQLARYAAAFGMSPSARSRVTASNNQGDLFGGDAGAQGAGWNGV